MLLTHSQLVSFLQMLQDFSLQNILTFFPIGRQRPGSIGLIGGKSPIACLFSMAAMCKGPVLAAIRKSESLIKLIYSSKDNCPLKS